MEERIPLPIKKKQILIIQHDHHEDIKERNRIAAKKWRDKKDSLLYELESTNDNLRSRALTLRNESLSLQTENKILKEELSFFQSFMTHIMNSKPKQTEPNETN